MKKIGLIGVGTIGSGVIHLFQNNFKRMNHFLKEELVLGTICDLDFSKCNYDLSEFNCINDWQKIIDDPEIDIVIELIGGEQPSLSIIKAALQKGKSVVTANKLLMAKYGEELLDIANNNEADLLYEAAVGGAIPIIRALKTSLVPNNIKGIYGIVNGTTNYILTKMQQSGVDYGAVLKEAQELGYAEADPSSDVDGYDSQYKLAILSAIAFQTKVNIDDILVEGITNISATDLDYCRQMNSSIKLVAIAQVENDQIELRIHPVILDNNHPLAAVNGVFNAVYVVGDAVGEMMLYGQGAGSLPTASAVLSDVIDIVKKTPYSRGEINNLQIKDKDRIVSEYYIRVRVQDKPGVLAAITKVLADHNISVASAIQRGDIVDNHQSDVDLVIVTHTISEKDKNNALNDLKELSNVREICSVIRVGL